MRVVAAMRSWVKPASNLRRSTSMILRMALRGRGIRLSKKVGEATQPQVEIQRRTRGLLGGVSPSVAIGIGGQIRSESAVRNDRNPWSVSVGIRGQFRSEFAVSFNRNGGSETIGNPGQLGPEYARSLT